MKGIVAIDFSTSATGIAIYDRVTENITLQTGFQYKKTIREEVGKFKNGNPKYKIIKKINEPHWKNYDEFVQSHKDYIFIIEDLSNSMGGKKGAGSLLIGYGGLIATLKRNGINYHSVIPVTWKSKLGLLKFVKDWNKANKKKIPDKVRKAESIRVAQTLYPEHYSSFEKDDNIAEALLILHWFLYLCDKKL